MECNGLHWFAISRWVSRMSASRNTPDASVGSRHSLSGERRSIAALFVLGYLLKSGDV